jgi:predicted phage terminase large subunit-like protein
MRNKPYSLVDDLGGWSIIYAKAEENGNYFFPERLNEKFLFEAKKTMGSMLYANQYLNEVFPEEDRKFRKEWFLYYDQGPELKNTFVFIDPAISKKKTSDYTGIVVIEADHLGEWYVRLARRAKLDPTEIIDLIFDLNEQFRPKMIGVETVAYQEAILYFLGEEMRKRKVTIPVTGVKRGRDSKEMRILALQPRFEWGRIKLARGLEDLETELLQFPRGSHDDIADALASLEELVYYPTVPKKDETNVHHNKPEYESKIIRDLINRANSQD